MNSTNHDKTNVVKPRHSVAKGSPVDETSVMKNIGERLAKRKLLFRKRRNISDICLICAMFGIILMIIYIEVSIYFVTEKPPNLVPLRRIIKWFISITTGLLLIFLVWYHTVDIQVFMIDNGMSDWRLALSLSRILVIGLELLICLFHPFPGSQSLTSEIFLNKNVNRFQGSRSSIISLDVLFSLPMFLRFFLVCRVLMLHSQLYQDASAQSLGALNRIHFNFSFIFKSLMCLYAEYVLTIMITFLFLFASWAIRACEAYQAYSRIDFFDSMWIIAITFLTVGYGDMVPVSTCGKSIAVMTG